MTFMVKSDCPPFFILSRSPLCGRVLEYHLVVTLTADGCGAC